MSPTDDLIPTPASSTEQFVPLPGRPHGWAAVEAWIDRHFWVPVLAIFIGGLVARVLLALPKMMNPDEAMHTLRSCMPTLWDVYKADLEGPDPSLLHVIIFPLCKMLASDFIIRLPSVLAGSFAVLFMYKWLKELFDRTTGLIGMILLAFAPTVMYFSAEVRAYSILVFFSLFALYCLEAGVRQESPGLMLLFGLGQCLALVSQYSALFLLFSAGVYSLILVLRRRIRGRTLLAWIVAEAVTLGLVIFQYVTHLSKLHGSAIENQMKGSFLSRAYFNPLKENVLTFAWTRTVAAFGFLFTWRYIGYVALALFAAGIVVLAARGFSRDGGRDRRLASLLFVLPWLAAMVGGALALYPFAGMRHVSLLIIFAVAGIAFMLRQFSGKRAALILLGALLLIPSWDIARIKYAAGWPIDPSQSRRSQVEKAVEYVRESMPDGGFVFSDLESHHVFRRYLFGGHEGSGRGAPAHYYEYDWNGFRMVTLKYWKIAADSLGDELHAMIESYGIEPGTPVAVVSCGWGTSLARYLAKRNITYLGTREFSNDIAVLLIPAGTEVMSDSLAQQVARTQRALYSLAFRLSQAIRSRAEMVLWPSSYKDSLADRLAGQLAPQVLSYRTFYDVAARNELPFDALLPGLAFWAFRTRESHAGYMNYMERGQSYVAGDCRFMLLATDPERLAAVYLVEPAEPSP